MASGWERREFHFHYLIKSYYDRACLSDLIFFFLFCSVTPRGLTRIGAEGLNGIFLSASLAVYDFDFLNRTRLVPSGKQRKEANVK